MELQGGHRRVLGEHGERRRRSRLLAAGREAFTLVELVVVLTVVGLLAVVSVGSFDGLTGSRQDAALSRVRSTVIFAQEWAYAAGRPTWVTFDTATDSLAAFVEDPLNPGRAGRLELTDPLSRAALQVDLAREGVELTSVVLGTGDELQFDASGAPFDEGGTALSADGVITLSGGGVVRVATGTGYVSVEV